MDTQTVNETTLAPEAPETTTTHTENTSQQAAPTGMPGPTTPPERTVQDVQREYQMLCGMLGECRYQIQIYEENAGRLVARLKEVNNEAGRLQEIAKKVGEEKMKAANEKKARKQAEFEAKQAGNGHAPEVTPPTEAAQAGTEITG